jgi:hypothetical protein
LRGANGPSGLGCLSGWAVRMHQLGGSDASAGRFECVNWSRRLLLRANFVCVYEEIQITAVDSGFVVD